MTITETFEADMRAFFSTFATMAHKDARAIIAKVSGDIDAGAAALDASAKLDLEAFYASLQARQTLGAALAHVPAPVAAVA